MPQLRPRRGVSYCSPVDRRFSDCLCQEAASRVLAQLTSSDKGCLKTGAAQRRMTDALNRGTLQHHSHAEQHAASSLAAHEAFAAHRRHVAAQERVGQGAGGEAAGLTRESSLSRRGSASGLRVVPQTPHTRPLSGACSPPRPALPVLPPILAGGEGSDRAPESRTARARLTAGSRSGEATPCHDASRGQSAAPSAAHAGSPAARGGRDTSVTLAGSPWARASAARVWTPRAPPGTAGRYFSPSKGHTRSAEELPHAVAGAALLEGEGSPWSLPDSGEPQMPRAPSVAAGSWARMEWEEERHRRDTRRHLLGTGVVQYTISPAIGGDPRTAAGVCRHDAGLDMMAGNALAEQMLERIRAGGGEAILSTTAALPDVTDECRADARRVLARLEQVRVSARERSLEARDARLAALTRCNTGDSQTGTRL